MATEIERKFLVQGTDWRHVAGVPFSQGYLNRDKERTVRVRIAGDKAFLTIKGVTQGATRAEFEYEIPVADAEHLLKLSDGPIVQKNRHVIVHEGSTWEVDEFLGDNAGLVVAEIELSSEDQQFSRPPWLGMEVTHDSRYFNSNLARHPYSSWRDSRISETEAIREKKS
jgi:adenylate cyclase